MSEFVEMEQTVKAEMNATISPAPSHLVDVADFECILCTR